MDHVRRAVLTLETAQELVTIGDRPRVMVLLPQDSWTEGDPWPGPRVSRANATQRAVGGTNGGTVTFDVTDIVRSWAEKGNTGLLLQAANELTKSNTTEFAAEDHATAAAPSLTVEYALTRA